ncbi:hypothetical protein Tco_1378231 [Tanacetum coccineum]
MTLVEYDPDCDEINTAKVALMANLSHYGSDALSKVHNHDNVNNDITYQVVQAMLSSEQSNVVNQSESKITSDSNIIPYSQYLIESQQEEVAVLRDLVDHIKANYPLDPTIESALAVISKNKDKRVRFTEPVTSSRNTITKKASTSNLASNKPMLSSTGVKPSTSASGSQPSGNTKKDKIRRTPSSTQMNKVEAHPRKVKSILKNKDHVVAPKGTAQVQHSKLNANITDLNVSSKLSSIDQDAPSPSNSQTTPGTQPPIIPNDVEEDNHDIEVAHMGNDPYFGIRIPEASSNQSLLSDSIHTIMHPDHQISEHNNKWTKDHPFENIIDELARPVSTRLQLHEQSFFCYYDAFLTAVEPKTYKDSLTQACWIKAMQEELNEFERIKVWELDQINFADADNAGLSRYMS